MADVIPFDLVEDDIGAGSSAGMPSSFIPLSDVEDDIAPSVISKPLQSGTEALAGGLGNILNGLSFGFGDEIIGGGAGAADYLEAKLSGQDASYSDLYGQRMAQSEALRKGFTQENPVTGYGGEIAGALQNPLNAVKLLKEASTVGRVAETGLNSAVQGGLFGLGENENRLENAERGTLLGGLFGAGGELVSSGVSKVGSVLDDIGSRLQLGAIGVTKSDAKKALLSGKSLPQAVDDIKASGAFKDGFDPEAIISNITSQVKDKAGAVKGLISEADDLLGGPTLPTFNKSEKFINELKGTEAKNANKYFQEEVTDLIDTLDNGGTLADWQMAKQSLQGASKYGTETSPLRNDVRKQIASDLRQHIEDGVDAVLPGAGQIVKQSNKEIGDRLTISNILKKTQAGESVQNPVNSLRDVMKTTGGFGVPLLLGGGEYARSGDPTQALLAAGVGAGLSSRGGQFNVGGGARNIGGLLENFSVSPSLTGMLSSLFGDESATSPIADTPPSITSLDNHGDIDMTPKATDIKLPAKKQDIVARIDSNPFDKTVFEMESSRGKALSNNESSAKGAFQLIDATAKKLGVNEVMDLGDNYKGFLALKAENEARFGDDPVDLYGSHFLGGTVYAKYLAGKPLTERQQDLVDQWETIVRPRFIKKYTANAKLLSGVTEV